MKHAKAGRFGGRRAALAGGFAVAVAAAAGITATAFAGSSSGSAVSLSDDFEDGNASGWSKSGGSWAVVADGTHVLRQSDAGTVLAREFAGDTSWTDYSVTAKVKAVSLTGAGASAGIAARAGGAHQFDRLVLAPDAARLEEVRGSTATVLASVTLAPAASGWHTLRVDVSAGIVSGSVDGVSVGSGATRLMSGRIGLLTTSAAASFDDVSVTAVSGATAAPTATKPATAPASPTASASPTATRSATASASPTASATATASPTAVATAWPKATSTTTLTATKKVSGTFDGANAEFIGGGDLGDGSQDENQDPLFELSDGATLSDVIIGAPAADGVHCLGSCTLRNVWWLDVGEDAATFKGTSASQTMTVVGGGAMHASDKVFQHNGPGTFVIKDFQATDIGKLYRSCGNCKTQFARHVQVSNVTVTAPIKTLAGINPNLGDTATITGATIVGGTAKNVCALFKGVTSGEPTETSNVPDGVACVATGITLK